MLLTPKSDIIQAAGRIGRNSNPNPNSNEPPLPNIVLDIRDTHPPFVNQWKRRKTAFHSLGFQIKTWNSNNNNNNNNNDIIDHTKKRLSNRMSIIDSDDEDEDSSDNSCDDDNHNHHTNKKRKTGCRI
jgi:hypothetical protein